MGYQMASVATTVSLLLKMETSRMRGCQANARSGTSFAIEKKVISRHVLEDESDTVEASADPLSEPREGGHEKDRIIRNQGYREYLRSMTGIRTHSFCHHRLSKMHRSMR